MSKLLPDVAMRIDKMLPPNPILNVMLLDKIGTYVWIAIG